MRKSRFDAAAITMLVMAFAAAPLRAQGPAEGTQEQGDVIVHACVDRKGELLSAEVARSSGYPQLDEAALKVAHATVFKPVTKNGKPRHKSCVHFKVKFVLKDGVPVPQGATGA